MDVFFCIVPMTYRSHIPYKYILTKMGDFLKYICEKQYFFSFIVKHYSKPYILNAQKDSKIYNE